MTAAETRMRPIEMGDAPRTATLIVPPVGSAERADGLRLTRKIWFERQPPGTRLGLKVAVAFLAVVPLVILLALRVSEATRDPLLVSYGIAVLGSTTLMFFVAYALYEDPCDHRFTAQRQGVDDDFPPLPEVPSVSMLLAVMNEIDVIDQCVASIMGSDYPDMQVIIVDDCSTDGTAERLAQLSSDYGFELIALSENVGKKQALVAGARRARGEVIAFTDSDCVLAPDGLRRCVAALVNNPQLGAVSGHARALNADETIFTLVQDTWYQGSFRVTKAAEAVFGNVTCVSGPLAVFRRDAIWNFLPAWANDRFLGAPFKFATDRQLTGYVLGQRWKGDALRRQYAQDPFVAEQRYPDRRWRVGYVESALVWTVVPETARAFFKQQVRWKKSFFRNLFFTGSFMWRRGPMATVMYYGHALWVLSAPFMAFRHLIWAPLHGLWVVGVLYILGVLLKGLCWGAAFVHDYPGSTRWRYRPLMSLISSVMLSWLFPYALLTIRRGTWARGQR